MAPYSLPAPSIIPLRLPVFGGPKSIDTSTKVQFLCETFLEHEIFYTLDGTKPQPYDGIVQGNKTIRYIAPIYLPCGKITVKAIAVNKNIHSMRSNVVTKCFEVLKVTSESSVKTSSKISVEELELRTVSSKKQKDCDNENKSARDRFNAGSTDDCNLNGVKKCLENAFIDTLKTELNENGKVDDGIAEEHKESSTEAFDREVSEASELFDDSSDESFSNPAGSNEVADVVDFPCKSFGKSEENFTDINLEGFDQTTSVQDVTSCITPSQNEETVFCCMKCDLTLQHCSSCKRMNAVSSKYCIECGTQLIRICRHCRQHNPSTAVFCQFCGSKVDVTMKLNNCMKVDSYVMAKPHLKSFGIQKLPAVMSKSTQTSKDVTPVKKAVLRYDKKDMPSHSPGRGYWHQQLDYICNHLKSHAYNNLEFRKTISEPMLCDFKSAQVTKDEENVTVTIVFSPLLNEKNLLDQLGPGQLLKKPV